MKVVFLKSFDKDLARADRAVRKRLLGLIQEMESRESLSSIPHVKKLAGFKDASRVRLGPYRLGFFLSGDTIQFAWLLNRKDIYRFLP